VSTHEAKTHLSRYLVQVENGQEIIITRGRKPVAKLVRISSATECLRPKVGETLGPRLIVPDEALRPLTTEELKEWGL
jgi:prevent-host-death family protein